MNHPFAKRSRPLILCLWAIAVLGCASVPKTRTTARDDPTARTYRKRQLVSSYEQRRSDIQYLAARSLVRQGDTAGAHKSLVLLLEGAPEHRAASLLAGETAIELNNPNMAIELASRLVNLDSNDADAHHLLGLALDAQGRSDEAKSHYQRAVQIAPENEIFAANWEVASAGGAQIAKSWAQVGGVQLAGNDDPVDSAEARARSTALAAGHRALDEGDIAQAERQYMAAMESAPNDPNIPLEAAVRLLQHNETGATVRLLSHACLRFRRSVPLLRTLATAQYRQGDYEFSQVALQQAVSLDNRDALSYFLLGAVREKLGDQRGAALSTAKAQKLRSAKSAHR